MKKPAEHIVYALLDSQDSVQEGWKSIAAAGMLGLASMHPDAQGTIQKAKHGLSTAKTAVSKAMAPRHMTFADPNKALPSEEKLSDWDYVEKKTGEREQTARDLEPVTKKYFNTKR